MKQTSTLTLVVEFNLSDFGDISDLKEQVEYVVEAARTYGEVKQADLTIPPQEPTVLDLR